MDSSSRNSLQDTKLTASYDIFGDRDGTTSSSGFLPCQILVQSIHAQIRREPPHRSYRCCRLEPWMRSIQSTCADRCGRDSGTR